MDTLKLITKPSDNPYNELGQTKICKFSWLFPVETGVFEQYFSAVKCKDYLEDLLISCILDIPFKEELYGFNYAEPIDISKGLYVSVKFSSKGEADLVVDNISLITELEGDEKTQVFRVLDDDTTIILKPATFWFTSPMLTSIYNFCIRVLLYNKDGASTWKEVFKQATHFGGNDGSYSDQWVQNCDLNFFMDNYEEILGDHPLTGYNDSLITKKMFDDLDYRPEDKFSMYTLHDYTGFRSFARMVNAIVESEDDDIGVAGSVWAEKYVELTKEI